MIQAYIITEGDTGAAILKHILPDQITRDVEFVVGQGSYPAQSIANTILAVKHRPVALVANANSTDESVIGERREYLRGILRQTAGENLYEVFLAVPAIESVFFQNPALIEKLAQRKLTSVEWELAKRHPKEAISLIVQQSQAINTLLQNLTDADIQTLRQHPLMIQLTEFLQSVTQPA